MRGGERRERKRRGHEGREDVQLPFTDPHIYR